MKVKKKTKILSVVIALVIAGVLGIATIPGLSVQASEMPYDRTATADPLTLDGYQSIFVNRTDETGRIWSDKSVSCSDALTLNGQKVSKNPNADFQVVMSALSSAGIFTDTKTTPLDITLVLDVSGSMIHQHDTTKYEKIYTPGDVSINGEKNPNKLFVYINDEYKNVNKDRKGYYYFNDENQVVRIVKYKTSEDDSGTQLYCYHSRIDELREASSAFIKLVKDENTKIVDEDCKHRIALTTFSADIERDYEYVLPDNELISYAQNLQMRKQGRTATHLAMQEAVDIDRDARPGAKRVVIMFTDGKPYYNVEGSFFATPGAIAVAQSKLLKQKGVEVFSVGMFDSDEIEDERVLTFMNAVSSNYPEAVLTRTPGEDTFIKNLGDPNENGLKYFNAVDENSSLSDIFKDIFHDISVGSGYATQTEIGRPETSGYVTYTDVLGKYTSVKSFDAIVFGDTVYKNPTKTTDGNTDTYVFEGEISTYLTEKTNLNKVIINVEKGKQETVTIKVPASAMPVYWHQIKKNAANKYKVKVMPAQPIRVSYSVGLSNEAQEQLQTGRYDSDFEAYIAQYTENNKLTFYSNDFAEAHDGEEIYLKPKTSVHFVPNRKCFLQL